MEWDPRLKRMRPFPGVASGGYMVEVIGGKHYSTPEGNIVEMSHGSQYALRICNSNNHRCRLQIKVDGASIGAFQMERKSEFELERPADQPLKFTFFRVKFAPSGSGITSGKGENGLISCTFTPEMGSKPAKVCVSAPTLHGSPGLAFNISDQAPAFELVQKMSSLLQEHFMPHIPQNVKNFETVQWLNEEASSTPLGPLGRAADLERVESMNVHDGRESYFSLLHLESLQILYEGATLDFDLDNNEPTCYNIFKAVLQHKEWELEEDEINIATVPKGRIFLLSKSIKTVFGQRHIYLALTKEESTEYRGHVKLKVEKDVSRVTMHIKIENLSRKQIGLDDLLKDETIYDVKLKLEEVAGIPVETQRLLFKGKQVEDARSLGSYNICDGSILYLVQKLRGGGDTSLMHKKQDIVCAVGDQVGTQSKHSGTLASLNKPAEKKEQDSRDPAWCAGATTLHGASSQKFQTVPGLEVDASLAVTLNLRLVARSDEQVDPTQYKDLKCTPLSTSAPGPMPE